MIGRSRMVAIVAACAIASAIGRSSAGADAPLVDPAELASRADLINRSFSVDDRIRYFLESKRGQGLDQLHLKRTEVTFWLPPRLKPARPPAEPNARVVATLKVVDGRLRAEVESVEYLPADLERFDQWLGRLAAADLERRRDLAAWAEDRGKALNEPKLVEKGQALEADVFWKEAARPDADPRAIADRATARPVPRGLVGALYHRAFRRKAAEARDVAAWSGLVDDAARVFPDATRPLDADAVRPESGKVVEYRKDPGQAYLDASPETRPAFDRGLIADLTQSKIEAEARANPSSIPRLAAEARQKLPDRAAIASNLEDQNLKNVEGRIESLRQSEVEALANTLRQAGQEARARLALETWLKDRRANHLSDFDAEGRVLLAANYMKLVDDRRAAGELLAEAAKIDPASKEVADAYLRLGYRKNDSGWYDPEGKPTGGDVPPARPEAEPARPGADGSGDDLRGLTASQARSRMGGKPDIVARSATQGQITEQWTYRTGENRQVILFKIEPGSREARVSASYLQKKSGR